ncbi:MAG: hypothetical protein V5A38_07580 [Halolamina sp.]|uniref:DUF7115 domain-containing protein n=1 Tax=Halolamina sp. TaxID=1940283 RepID=UPI002FC287A1
MSLPEIVTDRLDDEQPVAEVALGGDDRLFVTPSRTLVYRAEGLLSDETVEELPHDIERITVEKSRRKATLTLDYGIDGEESVTIPKGKLDDVLHPMFAGVLDAHGVTDPGESVKRTFRFSELTLIVTSKRVVKHIGQSVWNEEYEEYPYEDVTNLAFEPGNVATSVVLTLGDHQERFKAPNEDARVVEATVKDALFSYYDVGNIDEFREIAAAEEGEGAPEEEEAAASSPFGDGPDLFGGDDQAEPEESEGTTGTDGIVEQVSADGEDGSAVSDGSEPVAAESVDTAELATEVSELRETIEQQSTELDRQNELIEQLIEELRAGR